MMLFLPLFLPLVLDCDELLEELEVPVDDAWPSSFILSLLLVVVCCIVLEVVVLVAALQLPLSSTPDREFLAATLSLRAVSLSNLCKVVSSDLLLEL